MSSYLSVAYLFFFSKDMHLLSGKTKLKLKFLMPPFLVCVICNLGLQIYKLYTFLEV